MPGCSVDPAFYLYKRSVPRKSYIFFALATTEAKLRQLTTCLHKMLEMLFQTHLALGGLETPTSVLPDPCEHHYTAHANIRCIE